MALTNQQETLEHERRVAQMQADTELKRAQVDKVRQDWRLDPTRVVISAFIAGAATMGAVGTIAGFLLGRAH